MTAQLSVIGLILNASIVVQVVLAMLVGASITSWAVIFRKRAEINSARSASDKFEEAFWAGGDLTAMYRSIDAAKKPLLGMESIFQSGFREFGRLRQQGGMTAVQLIEGCRRSMRVALLRETDRLEKSLVTDAEPGAPITIREESTPKDEAEAIGREIARLVADGASPREIAVFYRTHFLEKSLAMLATVGSISPYVGLFGTVWGIMNAFYGLGNVQQATLAMVAPGISEALIATAMGLFAAIPAVIAYNRYADQVSRLELRYDTFVEELSTILQRHANVRPAAAPAAQ